MLPAESLSLLSPVVIHVVYNECQRIVESATGTASAVLR
ncbi:hypothetical protein MA5S0422_2913 [Mycobacteroides abscessus 5S-0422]|uniref:Uncharacterized protein n=1 Tax=Mycobacteroides abscessus subsp. bolletii 1513 TaxID=1299321 RepID=X8DWC2_9MYCO|nr:hypothetical protein MA5S0304_1977 [Mycobacteroides abscessus 5S-0304]EIU12958.1 hypothetical protein MA5S0421_2231 [Mycobacteroides abscessus 5S-0421]EIU13574.1 hypothetical protein MA5S0422_2913 [Mycobacteroides abscessus 5S-0422]EIU21177.1 hypothetical protein MA5S0708_4999 [Mycobacteroides abscessus 5S-0708]EIU23695.1 hypothetical protein MA5S0817_5054 [Mycobacteroides abscessus 5S-0817]EIU29529.1 hypothetical protein MA5S1212_4440 [Mycobacteroides abscessus 5S-1212]EIU44814.1 hypothet